MSVKRYSVAGHFFDVAVSDDVAANFVFALMDNYAPFETSVDASTIFCLDVSDEGSVVDFVEETRQQDEGQEIVCGKTSLEESVFEFYLGNRRAGTLVCSDDFKRNTLFVSTLSEDVGENHLQKFALNNSLMILYALTTSCENTMLFHSAVVTRHGYGYMFLGKSGTGKSTHARQWLKRFSDAELLNDDNPVVRLEQDGAWVYGSPWSGKTPCYKNCRVKLAAIVNLSQAPHNVICPIRGIEAYMALLMSISGMRWNKKMADGLHESENRLAQEVKMFHLECLPNEDAAAVCYEATKARSSEDEN